MAKKTKLAVIGCPIAHSLSPYIHNHWIKKHQLDAVYEKIEVPEERLKDFIVEAKDGALDGFNITVPLKEKMIPLLDEKDISVKSIGAVNTVCIKNGKLIGYNTDGYGFIQNMKVQGITSFSDKKIILLGAGGATRAAIFGLLEEGAKEIHVVNRTLKKAELLKQDFPEIKVSSWEKVEEALQNGDILVNTTSLGMKGKDNLSLDLSGLSSKAVVYDIVYNPLKTTLLAQAEARNLKTIDGLGMLIWQAAQSFYKWFGVSPSCDEELRQKLLAEL